MLNGDQFMRAHWCLYNWTLPFGSSLCLLVCVIMSMLPAQVSYRSAIMQAAALLPSVQAISQLCFATWELLLHTCCSPATLNSTRETDASILCHPSTTEAIVMLRSISAPPAGAVNAAWRSYP